MNFFPRKLARLLSVKEQLNIRTYYAIKVVIIGHNVENPPVMSLFIASFWSIEMVSCFCYCSFCLNELFSVIAGNMCSKNLDEELLLILCFCFVQYCSSFSCLFCKCTTFFLPCMVLKSKCRQQFLIAIQFLLKMSPDC